MRLRPVMSVDATTVARELQHLHNSRPTVSRLKSQLLCLLLGATRDLDAMGLMTQVKKGDDSRTKKNPR